MRQNCIVQILQIPDNLFNKKGYVQHRTRRKMDGYHGQDLVLSFSYKKFQTLWSMQSMFNYPEIAPILVVVTQKKHSS